ncbi:helix-turn-helix domain-containing protein [Trueperella pyogenes]
MSVTQAAETLGGSHQAINKRLNAGTLPGQKVGNMWVIPRHAVFASMVE